MTAATTERWSEQWLAEHAARIADGGYAAELERLRAQATDRDALEVAFEELDGVEIDVGGPLDAPCPYARAVEMTSTTGAVSVAFVSCKRRRCPTCRHRWVNQWVGKLQSCPMPTYVYLTYVDGDRWTSTTARLRERGAGWYGAPTASGARLVIHDDDRLGGERMRRTDALRAFAASLRGLTEADVKGRCQAGGTWRPSVCSDASGNTSEQSDGTARPTSAETWAATGVYTRCTTPDTLVAACEHYGGTAKRDPGRSTPDVDVWNVSKLSPIGRQAVRDRLGWRPLAAVQAEQAAARVRSQYDQLITRLRADWRAAA